MEGRIEKERERPRQRPRPRKREKIVEVKEDGGLVGWKGAIYLFLDSHALNSHRDDFTFGKSQITI